MEATAKEDHEEVVVVDADAIDYHAAVVVELYTARVTDGAMVHPWQLIDLTLLTITELSQVTILLVDQILGQEVVVKECGFHFRFEHWQVLVRVLFALLKHFIKFPELNESFTISNLNITTLLMEVF